MNLILLFFPKVERMMMYNRSAIWLMMMMKRRRQLCTERREKDVCDVMHSMDWVYVYGNNKLRTFTTIMHDDDYLSPFAIESLLLFYGYPPQPHAERCCTPVKTCWTL